jgi:CubicO group peptidase (beta-lactamase class C family)
MNTRHKVTEADAYVKSDARGCGSRTLFAHRRIRSSCWMSLLGVCLACAPSRARAQHAEGLRAQVDAYVAPLVQMRDFAGTIVLAREGQVLMAEHYGSPGSKGDSRADVTRPHEIGSVTKTMTAAAIELLAQRGRLALTDPVSRFFPGFAHGDSITITHLLLHSSGLKDYYLWPEYFAGRGRPISDSLFLAIAQSKPLEFSPGTGSAYSNTGYAVLAQIVERVSGMAFAHFLQTQLFEPSGMKSAGDLTDPGRKPKLAPGNDPGFPPSWLQEPTRVASAWLKGSGSVYASADDLLRWAEVFDSGKLVDRTALKHVYGWGPRTRFGRTMFEQSGRVPTGYASYLGIYPDAKVVIVVLSDIQVQVTEKMGTDLAAMVFGESYEVPQLRGSTEHPIRLNVTDLEEYAGRYQIAPGFVLSIRAEKRGLLLAGPDGSFLPLDTESDERRFFFRPLYVYVTFGLDSLRHVTSLDWNGQFKAARIR